MKTAYLTAYKNLKTGEQGFVWENGNEQKLSIDFKTGNEAINNKPEGYNNFMKL